MHHRSRGVGRAAAWLVAMTIGVLGGVSLPAQTAASGVGQPAAGQPSLTVDRDPVASPDPDVPTTATAGGNLTPAPGPQNLGREGGRYTLQTDVYEVRLNAAVIDGQGRPVDNLTKDDFRVFEDGVPQQIASFRHEDLPVSIGILIDSSGSMYDKKEAVEQAALNLIKLSNPQDEAFLVDFSFEPYIDQDFTSDIRKLQQGLGYLKSSGGTAMYDALLASADYLAKNAKRTKQVILLVTDGEDNASSASLEQAIRKIQDLDGPVVYSIGLLFGQDVDKREARHAQRVLQAISEQTGGVSYFPKSLREVDQITAEVAEDIRTQYSIAYRSTKPPSAGGYRQIHVEAKGKNTGKLQVRTRTGYYPHVASGTADSAQAGTTGTQH